MADRFNEKSAAVRALRRFVPRAFRYVLRPQDRNLMRFSLENSQGSAGIEQTLLVNLSETGAAFLITSRAKLHIGEVIKVEIPVPAGDQIAWWGRVVRLQEYESPIWMFGKDPFREEKRILVAVRFDELPEGHTRVIRKGIEQSFMQAMRDQQYKNWLYYRMYLLKNLGRFLLFGILAALMVAFIWYFTLPSENYDPKRGAPWGERFKF